jgi:hypothetical protein
MLANAPSYPQFGVPHSSSDGKYTEGLAYAYELAQGTGDSTRTRKYNPALQLAIHDLLSLQVTPRDVRREPVRWRALGAFRTRRQSENIRIDGTQHIMDAYRKILAIW